MDLLVQDLLVTTIAFGAALVLIQRVRGVVSSSRKSPGCDACPKCEEPRAEIRG